MPRPSVSPCPHSLSGPSPYLFGYIIKFGRRADIPRFRSPLDTWRSGRFTGNGQLPAVNISSPLTPIIPALLPRSSRETFFAKAARSHLSPIIPALIVAPSVTPIIPALTQKGGGGVHD